MPLALSTLVGPYLEGATVDANGEEPKAQFFRVGSSLVKEGALKFMTASSLKVYIILALHANWTTGKCWPSYGTIGALSGCSRNSIAGAIRQLIQLGAISCHKEKAENGLRNLYTVFRNLQVSSGTQSRTTDYPLRNKNRDDLGRFRSIGKDERRSRETDSPPSSTVDQNEIYLNESKRTRSKESPPAPKGSGRAPETIAQPLLTISRETILSVLKYRSRQEVIDMLRNGNYLIPEFLLSGTGDEVVPDGHDCEPQPAVNPEGKA